MRGEEDPLRRVLGFGRVAQQRTAEAADEPSVVAEQLLGPRAAAP